MKQNYKYIVKFHPFTSLVFNTAGEFTYMAPLSGNIKSSFAFPTISTCVGAFSTVLFSKYGLSEKNWIDNVVNLFNKYGIESVLGVAINLTTSGNFDKYYYIGDQYFVKKEVLKCIFNKIKSK